MKSEFFIVIYLLIILTSSEAAKILAVLPTPSISHQVVFRPFVLELVARGHEVTVITPDPAYPAGGGPTNLIEIDINEIYQDFEIEKHPAVNEYAAIRIAIKKGILNVTKAFNKQLNTDILKKFILDRNIEFDLLIIEAWLRPTLAFSYRFNVPVIRFGSVGSFLSEYNDMLGFGHPLFHPTNLCSRCPNIENLTFLEKIYEIYNYVYINTLYYSKEEEETETLRAIFGPEMPALSELSNNIDLYISNIYRTWELNRPMPLSVIQVGGIHLKTECMLPEDLQNYLDSSMNGVVYISFGTNMKTSWLDPEKLGMMVNVLSQIPMDVLWKWDEDELPGRTENIRISKWLPQECLLRHPKI
ncbi:UDP-glycosyltransferase UGT5-like [Galleria mellonella]|uniref:UDP-glycosyltransferase UGT5-like n=1 Tax=Galleria mellonella TaxID=7137 RepID=A0ABM3N0B6_GALME|nr:UDP-glycosyltransferase UGT5-like [Galleria mellonella]